jgi:hypothetical protein
MDSSQGYPPFHAFSVTKFRIKNKSFIDDEKAAISRFFILGKEVYSGVKMLREVF